MLKFFIQLLDWVYPKKCCFCKEITESSLFCSKCYKKITFLSKDPVFLDSVPVFYACSYCGKIRDLIKILKYYRKKELAFFVAKILFDYSFSFIGSFGKDFIIIPVPSHKERIKKRGFNHMELVAKHFGILTGFKTNFKLIKRLKNTKPQFNLQINEREKNIEGSFFVDVKEYNNETIILIDDIITTGSTITEIIKELKNKNISKIIVLSLSKTEIKTIS